jgi:CubicO group peptidase (beta-lactamase class C family)
MGSKPLALAVLVLLTASRALPQEAAPPMDNRSAQVDELFQKMNTPVTPGSALSVMKGGRIIYERGYGMADLEHSATITPTTIFHVASMSKQFAAASILLLAQAGKLSLDDPVSKYIEPAGLVLLRPKKEPDALHPVTRDDFAGWIGNIRFIRNNHGEVSGFLLDNRAIQTFRFEKDPHAVPLN